MRAAADSRPVSAHALHRKRRDLDRLTTRYNNLDRNKQDVLRAPCLSRCFVLLYRDEEWAKYVCVLP